MISEKKENLTVLSGEIEHKTTEFADNCGEFLTVNKHILDLE